MSFYDGLLKKMPINQCLLKNLKKFYGKRAKGIYMAMETANNKSTKKSSINKCKKDYPALYKKKKK